MTHFQPAHKGFQSSDEKKEGWVASNLTGSPVTGSPGEAYHIRGVVDLVQLRVVTDVSHQRNLVDSSFHNVMLKLMNLIMSGK